MFTENNKTIQCGFGSTNVVESNQIQQNSHMVLEDMSMSLCGILKCQAGIVAFGDSKNTIIHKGIPKINPLNPTIQKVFRFDNYLLAMTGPNQFVKNDMVIKADTLIDELSTQQDFSNNYKSCISALANTIQPSLSSNEKVLIGIGYKVPEYGIVLFEITRSNVERFDFPNKYGFKVFGASDLIFPANGCENFTTIDEAVRFVSDYMDHILSLGDMLLQYNPAGSPISIETLV
ncbi:MAG: hypothetical protein IJS33_02640 [Firmicutes bacterium]|nr:hypothetical protein [Bacillota bacterium]